MCLRRQNSKCAPASNNNLANTNSSPSDQGDNLCTICHEIVIGKMNFANHKKTHVELVSICGCGKRFLSKAGFKYHTSTCGIEKALRAMIQPSSCAQEAILPDISKNDQEASTSGKRENGATSKMEPPAKRQAPIVQAERDVPIERAFVCNTCHISFILKEALDFHNILHTDQNRFISDYQSMMAQLKVRNSIKITIFPTFFLFQQFVQIRRDSTSDSKGPAQKP